jgi:hypothetical protein
MTELDKGDLPIAPRPHYHERVVVKFHDHVDLPYDAGAATELDARGIAPWKRLALKFPGVELLPLFSQRPESLRELVRSARKLDRTYEPTNLLTYFVVKIPVDADASEVVSEFARLPTVAIAYVEPRATQPPVVDATDDLPWAPLQAHLDPAPIGIDARYAWGYPGGDGEGQALVDVEWGWNTAHEDLVDHGIGPIAGINWGQFGHGTAVLGVIAAVDNALGCIGVAPNLGSIRCVSQFPSLGVGPVTADPILSVIGTMQFGDVLLLEAQSGTVSGYSRIPVEVEAATWDAIRLATALGIVVIEAAGNGTQDLDAVNLPGLGHVFDRTSADFRDSGAIIVGAATAQAPHERWVRSCYGSRVDCYAWGEDVYTLDTDSTGTDPDEYQTNFGGTSAASAIVAGAALAVQGLAEKSLYRLGPEELRAILSDPALGTASKTPSADRIGVMPDLRAIIDSDLKLAPDVYLRDFVGDVGDPHAGFVSMSPDVILLSAPDATPQASFGELSGTEDDIDLSDDAVGGADNYVYVRVRNRGGSAAQNVAVTVYWSEVATLIAPEDWNLVGSTVIATVPQGDELTVSNVIVWPAAEVPTDGHYCFIATIGTPGDAAPLAPPTSTVTDFDDFVHYVRASNNVTWRNFNVVTAPVDPDEFVVLPFLARGAPDRTRRMVLEIQPRLPAGAVLFLEAPEGFSEVVQSRRQRFPLRPLGSTNGAGRVRIPLRTNGRTPIEFVLPPREEVRLRLLVRVDPSEQTARREIVARQIYDGTEVGRVVWRVVPPDVD